MRAAAADIQAAAEGFADFVASVAQQHAAAASGAAGQQAQQPGGQAQGSEACSSSRTAGDGSEACSSSTSSSGSSGAGTARLGDALVAAVRGMEAMEWMVPPMLQPR